MESAPPGESPRRPPSWLLALGAEGLPATLTVNGRTWRLTHTFKHDFFAATGLYAEQHEADSSPAPLLTCSSDLDAAPTAPADAPRELQPTTDLAPAPDRQDSAFRMEFTRRGGHSAFVPDPQSAPALDVRCGGAALGREASTACQGIRNPQSIDAPPPFMLATSHSAYGGLAPETPPASLAVAKLGRTRPIGPLPLRWIGRFLTRRESDHYLRLADLDGVPAHLGRLADIGFLHAFIPGRPLQRHQPVPDDFFPRLRSLLDALHARHMAYVDLQKRENILLGDDGRPYLIDFQISLYSPPGPLGRLSPLRWLLRRFQTGDNYHLLKHWRRHRPDQLSDADLARSWKKPFYVHLHNWITRPFTLTRRWILSRLDPDRVRGV